MKIYIVPAGTPILRRIADTFEKYGKYQWEKYITDKHSVFADADIHIRFHGITHASNEGQRRMVYHINIPHEIWDRMIVEERFIVFQNVEDVK